MWLSDILLVKQHYNKKKWTYPTQMECVVGLGSKNKRDDGAQN